MPLGLDQPTHILILLIILVLLFGSAKLPKAAKSLGESMRIFKAEAKKMETDKEPPAASTVQGPFQQQELPAATQAPTMEQAHQMAAQAQQMAAQAAQMAQQAGQHGSGTGQPPTSQSG